MRFRETSGYNAHANTGEVGYQDGSLILEAGQDLTNIVCIALQQGTRNRRRDADGSTRLARRCSVAAAALAVAALQDSTRGQPKAGPYL